MTSAISLPRRLLTLCSPSTHLMASTTFDLPEPFGPTTAVMPLGNSKRVLSAKLLKPTSSSAFSMEPFFAANLYVSTSTPRHQKLAAVVFGGVIGDKIA